MDLSLSDQVTVVLSCAAPLAMAIFPAFSRLKRWWPKHGKDVEKESDDQPACLVAEIERPRGTLPVLLIHNLGKGKATDVVIAFDGKPWTEHPAYRDRNVVAVAGDKTAKLWLNPIRDEQPVKTIVVRWKNGDGTVGESKTNVVLTQSAQRES